MNSENKSKAETFIGFCIRANKYRTGTNTVKTLKKINLLIVCETASENTKKEAEKIAKKYRCPLIMTVGKELSLITHKENVKLMAVLDQSLAKAITENQGKEFITLNQE